MADDARPPDPTAEPATELSRKPTVLLIEDEPEIRRFLRATLLSHEYRLFEAETGEEGLREAGRAPARHHRARPRPP